MKSDNKLNSEADTVTVELLTDQDSNIDIAKYLFDVGNSYFDIGRAVRKFRVVRQDGSSYITEEDWLYQSILFKDLKVANAHLVENSVLINDEYYNDELKRYKKALLLGCAPMYDEHTRYVSTDSGNSETCIITEANNCLNCQIRHNTIVFSCRYIEYAFGDTFDIVAHTLNLKHYGPIYRLLANPNLRVDELIIDEELSSIEQLEYIVYKPSLEVSTLKGLANRCLVTNVKAWGIRSTIPELEIRELIHRITAEYDDIYRNDNSYCKMLEGLRCLYQLVICYLASNDKGSFYENLFSKLEHCLNEQSGLWLDSGQCNDAYGILIGAEALRNIKEFVKTVTGRDNLY